MKINKIIIFILLFLLLGGLRLWHLPADPPLNLQWGRGAFTDESFYAHNARSKMLFDNWSPDEFKYFYISPMMAIIDYGAMSLGGVNYSSLRLASVLFSLLTVILFFLWLKKYYDLKICLLGAAGLGLNYFYLMNSRLALSEIPMVAFLLAAFCLLDRKKSSAIFLAGILVSLAILSKSLAVIFVIIAALFMWRDRTGKYGRNLAWFAAGMGLVVLVLYFTLIRQDPADYFRTFKIFVGQRTPGRIGQIVAQVFKVFHTEYFAQQPVTSMLAWGSLLFYPSLVAAEKKAFWWFLIGLGYLSLWSYTTPVYFLVLLIPMTILAVALVSRIAAANWPRLTTARWSLFLWFVLGFLLVYYIFIYYGRDWFLASRVHKVILAVLSLVVTSAFFWWWKNLQRFSPKVILSVIIILFLAGDFSPYFHWLARPKYSVAVVARDLQLTVGEGTVAGSWAPALCLETRLKEFPFWENIVNDKNLGRAIPVTHLLLERNYFDLDFVRKAYPELLISGMVIKTYDIDNRIIDLWKLQYDKK